MGVIVHLLLFGMRRIKDGARLLQGWRDDVDVEVIPD